MAKYPYFLQDTEADVDYPALREGDLRRILRDRGLTAPAADQMRIWDVIYQVREANPGIELGFNDHGRDSGNAKREYLGSPKSTKGKKRRSPAAS